jgi:hypothetical protein
MEPLTSIANSSRRDEIFGRDSVIERCIERLPQAARQWISTARGTDPAQVNFSMQRSVGQVLRNQAMIPVQGSPWNPE